MGLYMHAAWFYGEQIWHYEGYKDFLKVTILFLFYLLLKIMNTLFPVTPPSGAFLLQKNV